MRSAMKSAYQRKLNRSYRTFCKLPLLSNSFAPAISKTYPLRKQALRTPSELYIMSRVGNLVVHDTDEPDGTGEIPTLPRNSSRVKVIEAVVDLALSILETTEGKATLVRTATDIVTERTRLGHPLIYRDSVDRLPDLINRFVREMRVDFPFVYLSIIQGEGEAVRVKDPHWRNDLTKWQPKAAGPLYLHRHIINNMIACLRKPDEARENYMVFKFQMAITVAHEIVHFLTGLLIDPIPRRQYTPPRVTLEIYGDRAKGEAGRFFEKMLLGGVLECYEDPTDRLGDQQAGEPWVFPDSKNSSVGHRVSMAYIHRFINKGLPCPPPNVRGNTCPFLTRPHSDRFLISNPSLSQLSPHETVRAKGKEQGNDICSREGSLCCGCLASFKSGLTIPPASRPIFQYCTPRTVYQIPLCSTLLRTSP